MFSISAVRCSDDYWLMAKEKDRSGARPGEALCEEQEREYGGLSASVEVGNWYSEISVQML